MHYREDGSCYLVRLDKGERVRSALSALVRELKLTGGSLTAIGALSEAELAYFDEEVNEYRSHTFRGGLEVLSLVGNVSLLTDGEPMVHLHASLGKADFQVIGGHLNEGIVSVTLEVFLTPTRTPLVRKEPFGPFKLWDLTSTSA